MTSSLIKKVFVLVAANLLMTACGSGVGPEPVTDSGSVVLDFPGISTDLRKKVPLVYDLYCAADKTKIRAAKPVSAKDESPNPSVVSLKFKALDVKPGHWCAMEVNAQTPAAADKLNYRWLSKQKKVGLFYASEPAQVSSLRRLDIVMRVLFENPEQQDFGINLMGDLELLETHEVKKSELICGGIAYPAKSLTRGKFVVPVEKKDFSKGRSCLLRVDIEGEVYDSDEIVLFSTDDMYVAPFSAYRGQLQVATTEGEKCSFDIETMECVK